MTQYFNLLSALSGTLAYFAGAVAFLATDKSISANNVGVDLVAGNKIVLSAAEDVGNNGTFTLATVSTNKITVEEAITTNGNDAIVIREEWTSGWLPVHEYSRITGPMMGTVAASFYTDWAPQASTVGMVTVTVELSANTPLSHAVEIVAPFVRFRIRNNGAAGSVLSGALYAKALT